MAKKIKAEKTEKEEKKPKKKLSEKPKTVIKGNRGRKKVLLKEELGTPEEDIIAFIDALAKEKSSYANLRSTRAHLKVFLAGEHDWKKWNVDLVHQFRHFLEEKVKKQTVFGYIKALHLTFEEAARKRIISETPFDKINHEDIPRPTLDETERAYLSENELLRLLQTPVDLPFKQIRMLFLFACYTGLKWNDLVQLTFTDIVEKKHKDKTVLGYMYDNEFGKNQHLEFIPFFKEAKSIIEERMSESKDKNFEFIFEFLHETDIDERSINRRFNRLLKKYLLAMGVKENLNFHSARHTFAMLALKRGFDPYLLSKLLGYKTLAMVSVYSKISEAEKIEAVLAMNKE